MSQPKALVIVDQFHYDYWYVVKSPSGIGLIYQRSAFTFFSCSNLDLHALSQSLLLSPSQALAREQPSSFGDCGDTDLFNDKVQARRNGSYFAIGKLTVSFLPEN
ncbi:hypothetical protein D9758_016672 [Tetrapyrgos nigripes]|uniref:Uncharacterized protein n=1 Tax=Tetrapyrgos nigripes TaxID=182062 RepID=A0A8H5FI17_9AGAR|nr:hypothetical protein D9758_016672 [Tetrapyrgos nigripes]